MDQLTIKIPSLEENIRIVESFIDNANSLFHFSEDIYGNIMVSVTEAVNNAIVHGNNQDKMKNVTLSLQLMDEEKQLKFVITDEGPGFNHETLPDPTLPENLEKIGGRGIFLMKNLCDKVEFFNEGKTVELSFNL
jgi:serine/threonine-protein kinase RsbW